MAFPSFDGARKRRNLLTRRARGLRRPFRLAFGMSRASAAGLPPRVSLRASGMPSNHYQRAGRFTTLPRVLVSRKCAHASMSARRFSSASPRR
jgi:hypothetical protein